MPSRPSRDFNLLGNIMREAFCGARVELQGISRGLLRELDLNLRTAPPILGMCEHGMLDSDEDSSSSSDVMNFEMSEASADVDDDETEEAEQELHPAQTRDIASLLVHTLVADDPRVKEKTSCSICMDNFKARDRIRTLPCLHFFHKACIDEWLQRQGTCPICKSRVDPTAASANLAQEPQQRRTGLSQRAPNANRSQLRRSQLGVSGVGSRRQHSRAITNVRRPTIANRRR
jgi:hypothetical protein